MNTALKLLVIAIVSFVTINETKCQDSNCYNKYEFNNFLEEKTIDGTKYIETILQELTYPDLDRRMERQMRIRVLYVYNGEGEIQIYPAVYEDHCTDNFNESILRVLKKVNKEYLELNKEKFITEFTISFLLTPSDVEEKLKGTINIRAPRFRLEPDSID